MQFILFSLNILFIILIFIAWIYFSRYLEKNKDTIIKEKKENLFGTINMLFGLAFCISIALLLFSYEQIKYLTHIIENIIKVLSYSTTDLRLPASFIPTILGYILFFVALCAFILFFITRAILGKQTKLSNTFWEYKDIAKFKIFWCNLLFFIMLFLIFLTAFSCFGLIFSFFETSIVEYDNTPDYIRSLPEFQGAYLKNMGLFNQKKEEIKALYFILSIVLAFILVIAIFCAFVFQNFSLKKNSIDKLAKTLNATEILETNNLELKEQMLLNLISEMALASSCPMPRIFILKNEQGINAMCSGEHFGKENEKIAIFVTQGALDFLNRDELQGVIGHEFSHAFHHDVALNLRIFALVFALSCVMIVGKTMLQVTSRKPRTLNSKNDGKGLMIIASIGIVLLVLGRLGVLFAQIIQAAISRQKEFLADASSVQYTRNPQGLKSALQKIAQKSNTYKAKKTNASKNPTYLINPKASSCAHMFFLPCCAMIFATHPPLEQRIAKLEQMSGNV